MFKHGAFTLIELLVVMSIIALLSGLLLAGMGGSQELVERKNCENLLVLVGEGLSQYRVEYSFYPAMSPTVNNLAYALCHPKPVLPKTRADRDAAKLTLSYPNNYLYGKIEAQYVNDEGVDWTTLTSADVLSKPIPICDAYVMDGNYGTPFMYVYNVVGRNLPVVSGLNYDVRNYCQRGYQQESELWSAGPDGVYSADYHLHDLELLENKDNITMLPYK